MLFSNSILLNKYGKPIPKTWDELKEISNYIYERENNSTLIRYNGLFESKYLFLLFFIFYI